MKAKTMLSLLLLSAVCAGPAYANYFSDSRSNTQLNVGSAPSPTPEQLRIIGDSALAPPAPRSYRARGVSPPRYSEAFVGVPTLTTMEGRAVFGTRGAQLGYVLAVNDVRGQVELQTPMGVAVAMPASLIGDEGTRLVAPTVSRADVMAMARQQTGRTYAMNIY